jgi:hypothetical protein
MTPQRIQRKRTKGWRMPEGAVYVGRGSQWGNPYTVAEMGSRRSAVAAYVRSWLADPIRLVKASHVISELKGKDLACWCPDGEPCHADVLLDIANELSK